MGRIEIKDCTPKNPITLIGEMVGPCYGSSTKSPIKNYQRGLNCIKAGHGRVLEYATVWFVLKDYSTRFAREMYTHIGGAPTRTQASTRYIEYGDFDAILPPEIEKNDSAKIVYERCLDQISEAIKDLEAIGIKKEDAANLLPLGMTTVVSCHFNARTLMNMAEQRLCTRAYWEYRAFMKDLIYTLSNYSEEWEELCNIIMKCKCVKVGYCCEEHGCGKYPKKFDE